MVLIDPSAPVSEFDKVVCGSHVGMFIRDRRGNASILTPEYLFDVPEDAIMRPVIQRELAQHVMDALCRDGEENPSMPVWAEVWKNRDVLIAELAAALYKSDSVIRAALRRKDPTARAPECPWLLAGYEYLGPIRVERGLIIADRCYVDRDHMMLSVKTPALPGNWHVYRRYDPYFEGRTVSILVVHEDHFERAKDPGEEIGFFGVDAGCTVVMDQRVLDDAELVHALKEGTDWEVGLIRDIGCYTYTYDGDGMYRVRGIKSADAVVAVRVNVSRDENYDYHTPPPPKEYTKSLEKAMVGAGPAKPYAITATFVEGDRVAHKKFGEGLVTRVVDPGKIEVSFAEGVKTLVQGQKK